MKNLQEKIKRALATSRAKLNAKKLRIATKFSRLRVSFKKDFELEGGLVKLLLCAATIVAAVYTGSVLFFAFNVQNSDTKLGVFGDFIGGTLNPLLSFLAFVGVLITIALQRKELSESRIELNRSANALEAQIKAAKQQKFEASFFNMLDALDRIVSGIDLYDTETHVTHRGRDCFSKFYTSLTKIYRRNCAEYPQGTEIERVVNAFQKFWRDHQLELSAYFRFLYNVIRYIDESEQSQRHHIRLLRSQLSDQELLVIFYNCLTPAGSKMKPYVEKYAMFDNLPTLRLLNERHVELFSTNAFGSNEMHHKQNTGIVKISGPKVELPNREIDKQAKQSMQPKARSTRKRAPSRAK